MNTENFMLALGNNALIWCSGAIIEWIMIPFMNANMDIIFRSSIPLDMQGPVYSCRNTLQFFTVPTGYLLGGFLIDEIFEPLMLSQSTDTLFIQLFDSRKGSSNAVFYH